MILKSRVDFAHFASSGRQFHDSTIRLLKKYLGTFRRDVRDFNFNLRVSIPSSIFVVDHVEHGKDVVSVKGTCDLFGRLLFLAATHISIEKILEYPLLPEPPCFCHPDGAMYQSFKSAVFNHLTEDITTNPPTGVHTIIVAGMFMVKNTTNQHCQTFAVFARTMLMKALKLTNYRADMCFNVYESPSFKDIKRKDRGNEETERVFTFGPQQKFPADVESLLQISEFKKEFLKYFLKEYEDPGYVHILLLFY